MLKRDNFFEHLFEMHGLINEENDQLCIFVGSLCAVYRERCSKNPALVDMAT